MTPLDATDGQLALPLPRTRVAQPVHVPLNWRMGIPVLEAPGVFLREVQRSDAPALAAIFETREVSRHLPPGPANQAEFEDFIDWAVRARQAGRYISLTVVSGEPGTPVGFFQLWPFQPDFAVAEWGFALARPYWGTGLFAACARLVVEFAFETLGVRRLEARAAAADARGNGALQKIGARPEMLLRRCFPCWDGTYQDHVLWAIMAEAPRDALERRSHVNWALEPAGAVGNHRSLDAAFQFCMHPLPGGAPDPD